MQGHEFIEENVTLDESSFRVQVGGGGGGL
jgi:hypothetical protein